MKGTCQGCGHLVNLLRWFHAEGASGLAADHKDGKTGKECKGAFAPPVEHGQGYGQAARWPSGKKEVQK